jgi:RNA polymerase sigma-70 factor (ECF subfamily)
MKGWCEGDDVEGSERDLIRRCLEGDQNACTGLVEAHARMVGTVILRATTGGNAVEDLAQETFLRVFRALPYFDARAKLSTWIYTIAHRVAIDHLRKAGRLLEEPLTAPDDVCDAGGLEELPASGAIDPEAAAARAEMGRLVRDALARLPDKYRIPLLYSAIDGLDHTTIAAILDVPVGTVKTLVFRGKRMLKDQIAAALELRATHHEASDAM